MAPLPDNKDAVGLGFLQGLGVRVQGLGEATQIPSDLKPQTLKPCRAENPQTGPTQTLFKGSRGVLVRHEGLGFGKVCGIGV